MNVRDTAQLSMRREDSPARRGRCVWASRLVSNPLLACPKEVVGMEAAAQNAK